MKKTYIAPVVEIKTIAVQTLIATSKLNVGGPITSKTYGDAKDRGDYEPEDNTTFGDLW